MAQFWLVHEIDGERAVMIAEAGAPAARLNDRWRCRRTPGDPQIGERAARARLDQFCDRLDRLEAARTALRSFG